jgi:N-acetylmuramoyl-L-alanine amidase
MKALRARYTTVTLGLLLIGFGPAFAGDADTSTKAQAAPSNGAQTPPKGAAPDQPAAFDRIPANAGATPSESSKTSQTSPAQSNSALIETAPILAKDTPSSPDGSQAAGVPSKNSQETPPEQPSATDPTKGAAAAPAPGSEGNLPTTAKLASFPECDAPRFRIVLDVGHSAANYGALSAHGIPEFKFNEHLGEVVLRHLRDAGFTQTRLKVQDGRVNLKSRARDLDSSHPDLILSLHHDSVQDKFLTHGLIDGVVREYSNKFAGYSLFVSYLSPRHESSVRFARLLGDELKSRNHIFTMHHSEPIAGENRPVVDGNVGVFRYDRLVVLYAVNAPAVLMESAVIVNPDDEANAQKPEYQAEIGDSVVAAVRNYCATEHAVPPVASVGSGRAK